MNFSQAAFFLASLFGDGVMQLPHNRFAFHNLEPPEAVLQIDRNVSSKKMDDSEIIVYKS